MKKLILISALFISSFAQASDWCIGFDEGFDAGYCYQRGAFCLPPLPPICPLPTIYEDDTFEGGYNRGFVVGLRSRTD